MSEDDSWPTWFKGAVASGFVGALVTPLIEHLLSHFGLSFSWLTAASDLIVGFFLGFLTYRVAVWEMLAGIVALIGVLVIWGTMSATESPSWRDYTEDVLYGVKWRWTWELNATDGLGRQVSPVRQLTPFCPNSDCDMELELEGLTGPTRTECPRDGCGFRNSWNQVEGELRDQVKKEIERRRRTGEWKQHV